MAAASTEAGCAVAETEDVVYSTLPGGRLAPQPPVTRVAAGGAAFLIASVFAFAWAGAATLERLTAERPAVTIVSRAIEEPYRQALARALATQPGSPISVDADLVNFTVDRSVAADINSARELARTRAGELYDGGFPEDPGAQARTPTIYPRSFLTTFSAHRHENIGMAKLAALVGMATTFLLCAIIATGAARFLLPGAAAVVAYALLDYHVRLLRFWFEAEQPGGLAVRARLRSSVADPAQDLLFIAIALVVAGLVFRALRGPMSAVMRSVDKGAADSAPAAQEPRQ